MRLASPSLYLVLVVGLLTAAPTQAQTLFRSSPGPFAAADLAGGPFHHRYEQFHEAGGALGYRLGSGTDVALLVERYRAPADTYGEQSGATRLGAEVARWGGSDRFPRRFAFAVGTRVDDRSGRVFLPGPDPFLLPSELRGGPQVSEIRAILSAVQYVRVGLGPLAASGGAGPYLRYRRELPETVTYESETGEQRTERFDAPAWRSSGLAFTAAVGVGLWGRATVSVGRSVWLGPSSIGGGIGTQTAVRLNL